MDTKVDFENATLGEWLTFWYDTYKKPKLKENSLRNIEQQIRLHTPEWLKNMQLKAIKVFHIDKALLSVSGQRTRKYAKQVWHNAFKKAQQLEIIEKNVVMLAEDVKYKKVKSKALTISEQKQFIERLEGKRVKWLMLFYLFTGVRRTEAATLTWSDINMEEGLILIRGTKTEDSYRNILLTEDIKSILEGQRNQIEDEKGTRYQSKNPEKVFDYSPSYISQAFKKLCPNHHLHDLRHTYVTRCCECGMNINVCQQLVGHSTPQMTLEIYTHIFDDFKRKEALKFSINPTYNL